jgi:hypothetical protein
MDNDNLKYDFELVSSSDYKCVLSYWSKDSFLMSIFNLAKDKLARKEGLDVNSKGISDVNSFDVDSRFFNYLRTCISKHIKKIYLLVGRDKIVLLNDRVTSARFKRDKNKDWMIYITFEGQYIDKR